MRSFFKYKLLERKIVKTAGASVDDTMTLINSDIVVPKCSR